MDGLFLSLEILNLALRIVETLQFQGNKRMGDAEKNMQVCPSPTEVTFQYIKRTFLYAKVGNPQICRKMVRNLI